MAEPNKCCCPQEKNKQTTACSGAYVCYCNKVTEKDIALAIEKGAATVEEIIAITGAMVNSNCKVNNPKGICCYPDIVKVSEKYFK